MEQSTGTALIEPPIPRRAAGAPVEGCPCFALAKDEMRPL